MTTRTTSIARGVRRAQCQAARAILAPGAGRAGARRAVVLRAAAPEAIWYALHELGIRSRY
eukprot:4167383-Pleurochrysis_carterae.AAC.1